MVEITAPRLVRARNDNITAKSPKMAEAQEKAHFSVLFFRQLSFGLVFLSGQLSFCG